MPPGDGHVADDTIGGNMNLHSSEPDVNRLACAYYMKFEGKIYATYCDDEREFACQYGMHAHDCKNALLQYICLQIQMH